MKILMTIILILNFVFISFADDYQIPSNMISWEEMNDLINNILDNDISEIHTDEIFQKEYDFLYFAYTVYGRDYDEYLVSIKKLLQKYRDYGIGIFYRPIDKEIYLKDLHIYTLYHDNINTLLTDNNIELVIDSGFSLNNVLPIYNFGINGIEENGNCFGLDSLSVLSYQKSELLKGIKFNFLNDINYNDMVINTLNLSDYIDIMNSRASDYKPDSHYFISIHKSNYSDDKIVNKLFLYDSFKNKKDLEVLNSILLLQKWNSRNFSYQTALSIESLLKYTQDSLCPISELDLVKNELENGRPVYVCMTDRYGSGHNLIGYSLYHNKLDSDYYYLRVIDTNKLNNESLYLILLDNGGLLYSLYAPYGFNFNDRYLYEKKIEFMSLDAKLLHRSNTSIFWDKDYNTKVLPY